MKPLGPDLFDEATNGYRAWLGARITITDEAWSERREVIGQMQPVRVPSRDFLPLGPMVAGGLRSPHRWTTIPNLNHAPQVLGVGDLHVENFGTWRDAESRLVWGINDFDEACCLPYTQDLVRLAASARFAIQERHEGEPCSTCRARGQCSPHCRRGRPRVSRCVSFPSLRLWRCHRSPRREERSTAVHPRGRRRHRLAAGIVINKLRTKGDSSEFTKFLASLKDLPRRRGRYA